MTQRISFYIYLTSIMLLFLNSCKKQDEFSSEIHDFSSKNNLKSMVHDIKFWYDSTINSKISLNSQNSITSMSLNSSDITVPIIDWNKAFVNFDSTDVKSLTIPLLNNYINGESIQLVVTTHKNKKNGYIIKITPDSIFLANQIKICDYKNFSGSISIYNLMGKRLKTENFISGISAKNNDKVIQSIKTNFSTEDPCEDCDLPTVTVYSSKKIDYSYDYGLYDYGLIYISTLQYIQSEEFGGVIAGGIAQEYLDGAYFYKFQLKSDYITKYPKFTELIKNIYQNSLKNPKILDWLKSYSHMTDEQIYTAMQFNQGPTIIITDINDPNSYIGPYRYGKYNMDEQKIYIDIKTIEDFERGNLYSFDAYTLFLYATILHETVHYGNSLNNFNEGRYEYGNGFEIKAFGSLLELNNK